MKLSESIIKWWAVALAGGLLGAIGWFGTRIFHAAVEPFWKHIAPAIPQTLLLSLCCLLLLIIALLVTWVVYLHRVHREPTEVELKKQFEDRFGEFVPKLGIWKHKTKPGYYCSNCKENGRESRLIEGHQVLICPMRDCKFYVIVPKGFSQLIKEGEKEY